MGRRLHLRALDLWASKEVGLVVWGIKRMYMDGYVQDYCFMLGRFGGDGDELLELLHKIDETDDPCELDQLLDESGHRLPGAEFAEMHAYLVMSQAVGRPTHYPHDVPPIAREVLKVWPHL